MPYCKSIIDTLNAKSNNQEPTEKPRRRCVQHEGGLQIQCVSWFRYQYKAYGKLLIHPRNEAGASASRRVAIDAAAGVVPGVPDLLLLLPARFNEAEEPTLYFALGIELKFGHTNNQTPAQKEYQCLMESAGYRYVVVRSLEEFQTVVNEYMRNVSHITLDAVKGVSLADNATLHNKALLARL